MNHAELISKARTHLIEAETIIEALVKGGVVIDLEVGTNKKTVEFLNTTTIEFKLKGSIQKEI